MKLGEYIRGKRHAMRLTVGDLAILTDLSQGYLYDFENDRRSLSVEQLPVFAKIFGLDVDYLYFLKGVLPPDIQALNLSEAQVRSFCKLIRKER